RVRGRSRPGQIFGAREHSVPEPEEILRRGDAVRDGAVGPKNGDRAHVVVPIVARQRGCDLKGVATEIRWPQKDRIRALPGAWLSDGIPRNCGASTPTARLLERTRFAGEKLWI